MGFVFREVVISPCMPSAAFFYLSASADKSQIRRDLEKYLKLPFELYWRKVVYQFPMNGGKEYMAICDEHASTFGRFLEQYFHKFKHPDKRSFYTLSIGGRFTALEKFTRVCENCNIICIGDAQRSSFFKHAHGVNDAVSHAMQIFNKDPQSLESFFQSEYLKCQKRIKEWNRDYINDRYEQVLGLLRIMSPVNDAINEMEISERILLRSVLVHISRITCPAMIKESIKRAIALWPRSASLGSGLKFDMKKFIEIIDVSGNKRLQGFIEFYMGLSKIEGESVDVSSLEPVYINLLRECKGKDQEYTLGEETKNLMGYLQENPSLSQELRDLVLNRVISLLFENERNNTPEEIKQFKECLSTHKLLADKLSRGEKGIYNSLFNNLFLKIVKGKLGYENFRQIIDFYMHVHDEKEVLEKCIGKIDKEIFKAWHKQIEVRIKNLEAAATATPDAAAPASPAMEAGGGGGCDGEAAPVAAAAPAAPAALASPVMEERGGAAAASPAAAMEAAASLVETSHAAEGGGASLRTETPPIPDPHPNLLGPARRVAPNRTLISSILRFFGCTSSEPGADDLPVTPQQVEV